jgi:hypothetical protein
MESSLEEVRREIEQTRARITEKISLLQEEVERTKRTTLNPAYHARKHPLPALGMSLLAGWILARLATPRKSQRSHPVASDNRFASNGVPKNRRRSVVARAALAGIKATASSLIVRDLVKGFLGDYVKRRWSRRA